jgi:hypothetical protein
LVKNLFILPSTDFPLPYSNFLFNTLVLRLTGQIAIEKRVNTFNDFFLLNSLAPLHFSLSPSCPFDLARRVPCVLAAKAFTSPGAVTSF